MRLLCFGKSVKGKDHIENEDGFLIDEKLKLFAVADGVSEPKGGREACQKILGYLKESFKDNLKEAFEEANKKFVKEKREELFEGYSTLSAVQIKENVLEACNVGDSPIFLIRNGKIENLAFIDKIFGTNILAQAMGEDFIHVHSTKKELKAKDFVLLATDGITDILTEGEILEIVDRFGDVEKIGEAIVEKAEKKISFYDDDKTLILIKVVE
jgi:serine/threonine protein phosphatase PrpC